MLRFSFPIVEQFLLECCFVAAHYSGNRWSYHCPFIADSLCSAGGIICGGRVASPGNVFHQLQLYRMLSIGVEIRVVKSPSSSFVHISETERRGVTHLFWIRCGSLPVVCVCVCVLSLFPFLCVCVCDREHRA